MALTLFSDEKKEGKRVTVVGFVRRVVAAAMGCFFACFRNQKPRSRSVCPPCGLTVSSLFLYDDENDDLLPKGGSLKPLPEELEVSLEDEAKFLKACGTLLETPIEIRESSRKWMETSTQIEEEKLGLNSWLPNSFSEKESDESPLHVKNSQEWLPGEGFLVATPSSCRTNGRNTRTDSTNSIHSCDDDIHNITPTNLSDNATDCSSVSSVSPEACATIVQSEYKCVHFECESEKTTYSSGSSSERSKWPGSVSNYSISKASPYPTPLKLTDEMQTPGTVFPAYLDNMVGRKTTRIRSQYVHSSLYQVEHEIQERELKDENSNPNEQRESLHPSTEVALAPNPPHVMSSWLKHHSATQYYSNEQSSSTTGENVRHGTTRGESPIVGVVGIHWNDDETYSNPKWWDGNGIPNTTSKYKEDQKVSWHATPFEVRLKKALSDEHLYATGSPSVEQHQQLSWTAMKNPIQLVCSSILLKPS